MKFTRVQGVVAVGAFLLAGFIAEANAQRIVNRDAVPGGSRSSANAPRSSRSVPGTGRPTGSAQRYESVPGTGTSASSRPRSVPGTGYSVPGTGQSTGSGRWRLGVHVRPVGNNGGLLVTDTTPDGAAERMGIEPGDIIVQINGRPVRGVYDLRQLTSASGGYARVKVLDNRTEEYLVHRGDLD